MKLKGLAATILLMCFFGISNLNAQVQTGSSEVTVEQESNIDRGVKSSTCAYPSPEIMFICPGSPAVITPNTGSAPYIWFSEPFEGGFLQKSSSYDFGSPLADTGVFYSSICADRQDTLSTVFAGGNSHRGNMFDVTPSSILRIDGITVNAAGATTIEVYYKIGTYVGNENNAGAWTLLGSASASGGINYLNIGGVFLQPGMTYGMYVTSNNTAVSLNYTDGAFVYTNSDLVIATGCGIEYPFSGSPFNPRSWNGTLHYSVMPSDVMDVGVQSSTFSNMSRGFYFQAPSHFIITGLQVPNDISGDQTIEIIKFNSGAPPSWSTTTNDFTTIGRWENVNSTGFIDCYIPISTGDHIGIMGVRGGVTSYRSSGNYNTSILGDPVTLTRLGMQYNLSTDTLHDVWQETGSIGRVNMRCIMREAVSERVWAVVKTDDVDIDAMNTNEGCYGDNDGTAWIEFPAMDTGSMDVGPHLSTYSNATHTRGYYFIAPNSFTITELYIPQDASSEVQNISVVRLPHDIRIDNTITLTSLYYGANLPANSPVQVNIPVFKGQIIGVLGARGTSTMHNSYNDTPFKTIINGDSVNLYRLMYQENLNSVAPNSSSTMLTYLNGSIGRVEMKYKTNVPPLYNINWNPGGMVTDTVLGLEPGNYVVTVTTATGCYDTASVVVQPGNQVITDLGPDTTICIYNTITLNAGMGFSSYLWSDGSTTQTITVDSNSYSGSPLIYFVEVSDGFGCMGYDTIVVDFDPCAGVEEYFSSTVKVYPNPSDGRFTMLLPSYEGEVIVEVVDIRGSILLQEQIKMTGSSQEGIIDIIDAEAGMYLLRIRSEDFYVVRKLFKE